MTDRRVGTTRQAAKHFGFVQDSGAPHVKAFLSWVAENKINPVHGKRHHLWWDFKVIENVFDKVGNTKPDLTDWDKKVSERLAQRGDHQGAISRY